MKYDESCFTAIFGIFRKNGPGSGSRMAWRIGLLSTCIAALGSCGGISGPRDGRVTDPEEVKRLIIATWNVQALFDGEEAGNEYTEYRMAAGWSEEKYRARLTALGDAVARMTEEGAPDILALQEVETGAILQNLAEGPLAKYGYAWTFFAGNAEAPLGLGLLSRLPLLETKTHSITCNGETSPRPMAEVRMEAGKRPLVLFICHWKSKVEGDDATEALRRASAQTVLRRLREIGVTGPDVPVIILGDLNENHDEFYRREGAAGIALLPDDPEAAELSEAAQDGGAETRADFLVISGQKPPCPRYFAQETPTLYSPWVQELENGTYYYQGGWETLDHFLLTPGFFDDQGWEFDACEAPRREPFINDRGIPRTYNPRTGNGLSDHLPLLLMLTRVD
ncbi:MAG: endonuclease/exonuclease/phosphatase family protein [Treponema sp.]|nr:endonuclease/exonuclease/phosphatase family protein [Treponema sp.]